MLCMRIHPPMQADSIAKDLKFFLGDDWSDKYKPTPAAQAYVTYVLCYNYYVNHKKMHAL